MARPRDDHLGPPFEELPPPGLLDVPGAGGRAGSIRLGPDYAPGPIRQTRISLAPGLRAITGQKVVLGPQDPTRATGFVGWEEVLLDLPGRQIRARVCYPAQGPDRFGQVIEGEGAPLARAFGGWPVVALVHGYSPTSIWFDDEEALCPGVELGESGAIDLFARWTTIQRGLARVGYVSIAPDMSFRDPRQGGSGSPVENVVGWLLATEPWGSLVDAGRLGLAGHSVGALEAARAARTLDAKALALVAPVPDDFEPSHFEDLDSATLTIGSTDDTNGDSSAVYADATAPRHLVLLGWYSHFAYFDGVCSRSLPDDARIQRARTLRALRRFFDRYLLGTGRADLGLRPDPPGTPGIERVCQDLGDGSECDPP